MLLKYRLVRAAMNLARLLLRARIEVEGRDHIPATGPYVVVLNHTSVVDTPVLLMTFPVMRWRFFAVDKWRWHPIYGPIMAWLGAIYVRRDEVDRQQLRAALAALQEGVVFGLAPEGKRSFTGQMIPAKDGAAYLASRSRVPIVPVGLINHDILWQRARRLQPTTLTVRIGRPFVLPDIGRRPRSRDLPALTHFIMIHIAALLPPRYHGVYASSPALASLQSGGDPWSSCQRVALSGPWRPQEGE